MEDTIKLNCKRKGPLLSLFILLPNLGEAFLAQPTVTQTPQSIAHAFSLGTNHWFCHCETVFLTVRLFLTLTSMMMSAVGRHSCIHDWFSPVFRRILHKDSLLKKKKRNKNAFLHLTFFFFLVGTSKGLGALQRRQVRKLRWRKKIIRMKKQKGRNGRKVSAADYITKNFLFWTTFNNVSGKVTIVK